MTCDDHVAMIRAIADAMRSAGVAQYSADGVTVVLGTLHREMPDRPLFSKEDLDAEEKRLLYAAVEGV